MIETEALNPLKVKTAATMVDTDHEVGQLREEVAMISESFLSANKSAQQNDHVS